MSPARPSLARIRADRLLRREYESLRSAVIASARRRLAPLGVHLDPADLEACYSQAWQGLYATVLAGERVANPHGWLALATQRRAIEEWRLLHPGRRAPGDPEGEHPAPALEERVDDLERLRAVFEALRGRLSLRECEAATLCYLQGLSRGQAAAQMGISERRMRKLMEGDGSGSPGVAGKVAGLVDDIRAGRWCEQQASLMRAYAFGLLESGGERHALALAHLRRCSACRAYVASLRGLSAIVPPTALPFAVLAGRAGLAGGGAAAGGAGASSVASGGMLLSGAAAGKVAAGCVALVLGAAGVAAVSHRASRHPHRSLPLAARRAPAAVPPAAAAIARLGVAVAPAPAPAHVRGRAHRATHRRHRSPSRTPGSVSILRPVPPIVQARREFAAPVAAPPAVRRPGRARQEFGFE